MPVAATSTLPVKIIDIDGLINQTASEYHLNASHMKSVIKCESNFDDEAVGDNGHAHGLVQINDIYNASTTPQEAFDPQYSVTFMAQEWANGEEDNWSCYRIEQAKDWQ